ncbi:MAG: YlbF family regulator [Lachnospiraceae bacterium]|nr:YlbF family regulator [Lachnospiraceae bacterium]
MSGIDKEVKLLIEAILHSGEYAGYINEKERLKQMPEVKERVDEFRRRNFELQNSGNYSFDKADQLEREFSDVLKLPEVSAFLDAELAFCRMMQEMNSTIADAIVFE